MKVEHLTPAELEIVVDGCGLKRQGLVVPDFGAFDLACARHDLAYWRGGTEMHRCAADEAFRRDMLDIARAAPWWRRPWLLVAAWTYACAVSKGGWLVFDYRAVRRTYHDLGLEASRRLLLDAQG